VCVPVCMHECVLYSCRYVYVSVHLHFDCRLACKHSKACDGRGVFVRRSACEREKGECVIV